MIFQNSEALPSVGLRRTNPRFFSFCLKCSSRALRWVLELALATIK